MQTLDKSRKQLELQAIPQTDVLKAQSDLATRKQELTVANTTLEQQELYMKNAITRSLEDPVLEDMPVVPLDKVATDVGVPDQSIQDMAADALKNRPDVQEQVLQLQNSELSRKTERNALLPSLSVYGFMYGQGYSGPLSPTAAKGTTTPGSGYGGALGDAFNYSSPEYQVGFQMSIPLRNRVAKADQYRSELEYRQSQVGLEEKKKSVLRHRGAVRGFALEQGDQPRRCRAREARDLSAKRCLILRRRSSSLARDRISRRFLPIMTYLWLRMLLVTAETDYAKARVQMLYVTGTMLETYGISIEQAKSASGSPASQAQNPTIAPLGKWTAAIVC